MEITEKADNMDFIGCDPVKLLISEGTEMLGATGTSNFVLCSTAELRDSTLRVVNDNVEFS